MTFHCPDIMKDIFKIRKVTHNFRNHSIAVVWFTCFLCVFQELNF